MNNSSTPGTIEYMRSKIKHVVYYMLENRSFDHVCGWLYENDQPAQFIGSQKPFDGANLSDYNPSNPNIELSNGNWKNYYDTAVTFQSDGKNYLFAQTEDKKRWFISEITTEGVGNELASNTWKNYYGTAVVFVSGGKNYLFAQTEGNKRYFIAEITPNGVGKELANDTWKNYYGTALTFSSEGKNYLFAQTEGNKRYFIAEITPNGVEKELVNDTWKNYYGTAAAFISQGKNYVFAQTEGNKRYFTAEITPDGVGKELANDSWKNYYGVAVISAFESKNYLFAQTKGNKRWFVSEVTPDGVEKELSNGTWNNYYGTAAGFTISDIPYVFMQTDTSNDRWFIAPATPGVPIHLSKYKDGENTDNLTCPTKGAKHGHTDVMNQLFGQSGASYEEKETPPMMGFVIDNETKQAIETYTPNQLTILNGLAKNYAVSDAWFSSIPGPTDVNRAFSLTGSSFGRTTNFETRGSSTYDNWPKNPHPASIWKVLWDNLSEEEQKDWKIYYQDYWGDFCYTYHLFVDGQVSNEVDNHKEDFIEFSPMTGENSTSGFLADIKNGTLPKFSYIEPAWVGGDNVPGESEKVLPNSYHPSKDVSPGEDVLNRVYNAIQNSETYRDNTLLIVTFDEHGGQYDHVSPPYGTRPFTETHPDSVNDPTVTSDGFEFDLFGVRVPTILISPLIEEKTVFRSTTNIPYDSTSFLSTLLRWYGIPKENWGLGARVANAPTFEGVLNRTSPREVSPKFTPSVDPKSLKAEDISVNGLHREFVPRILSHLAKGKLKGDSLEKVSNQILNKAKNIAELHGLLKGFQKNMF